MALSQIQNRSRGPSQEYLLLDYLQRLGRNVEGRMAVHIHLSRLRPQNRQEHHIRIAAATTTPADCCGTPPVSRPGPRAVPSGRSAASPSSLGPISWCRSSWRYARKSYVS